MDKYELNIKEDKIKKHVEKKDYAAAAKIADTIDWSKIKNLKMLTLVSQVYEKTKNYTEAKNILLFAYERVPVGRRMLYKLTELCVKAGNIDEAEAYFEEFQKIAPNDIGKLLLAYQIEAAKGGETEKLITILELYRKNEFEEKWAYELAYLYHKAGRVKECVQLCNEIILWFSVGTYVDKALNLKMQYEPLTPSQQEKLVNKKKFEARVRAVEREFETRYSQGIQGGEDMDIERRREEERMKEAALTREETAEEPQHVAEETVVAGEAADFGEEQIPEEAVYVSEGEISKDQFHFVEEPGTAGYPYVLEAPLSEEPHLSEKDFTGEPAGQMEKRAEGISEDESGQQGLAGELYHMQADLAQAIREAENESRSSAEQQPEAPEEMLGQTKEVVGKVKEALKPEPEKELGQTDEFFHEVSAALGKNIVMMNVKPAAVEKKESAESEKKPAVVETEPVAVKRKPVMEEEKPAAVETEPVMEEEKAVAMETEPAMEEEKPTAMETEAVVEEEKPAASDEKPVEQKEGQTSAEKEPEISDVEEPDTEGGDFEITCVVVEAEPGAERIPFAVEKLKKTHEVLGSAATQVAKISGEKLSAKGVHNTFMRLAGRDLIVDNAADLSHEAAAELAEEIDQPFVSLVIILVDSSERMDKLLIDNPELDRLCVYLEEGSQMDVDEFVACANEYAKEEECVIDEMANLAIYAVAERLRNNGTELTEEAARKLVDEAIDKAEHRGIKGLFGSKYDKGGYLILKEQFFKNI
ncbi:MAG: hypothetical protein HFI68_01215 [Lachnospiraceae bacterium]|nr:hypothetical protein [Lachnospiraceae bacterium]